MGQDLVVLVGEGVQLHAFNALTATAAVGWVGLRRRHWAR